MTTVIQKSFAAGEIAPALYARTDTSKYATGLRICRNNQVMRHGGAQSRAGTTFIQEVKDSSKAVRLLPFVFNASQTYVLEFGDQYLRVIKAAVQQTLATQAITNVANAAAAVVTYAGADTYANGDEVYISGIVGPIGLFLNNRTFKVANVNTGTNTFDLRYMDGTTDVNSTSMGAYTSGGTLAEVYTLATPYAVADLPALQLVQSADVITIVHPSYAPRELTRSGDTSWAFATITFSPEQVAPTGVTNGGGAGASTQYVVTAVNSESFEESLASTASGAANGGTSGGPAAISWTAASGAGSYNVYKLLNGVYGFIGVAVGLAFSDNGIPADTTQTPPTARNPFSGSSNYPSAVAYYQERLGFANSDNDPEKGWFSKNGAYKNFTVSSPLQDDDAVTFTVTGRQVNEIRHMLDLGTLVLLTTGGEHICSGDGAGVLTPTQVNRKQQSSYGSSELAPIIVGGSALFVQARGSSVRDLGFDFQSDGYRGNDLTIYSAHLFEDHTIVDWAYQQIPNSIVWAVRDDGVLLGLTYIKEQEILAWHRHDTDGLVENVCVVPEGNEDVLYIVVKRTINGLTKRYIERLNSRFVDADAVEDFIGMDSTLSLDGWNSGSTTMTLSEYLAGGWDYTSTITVTASGATFASTDVGNSVFIVGADDDGNELTLRINITAYVSSTVVRGRPHRTVPTGMRTGARADWARAVDQLTGLWHIEGKDVSILADGLVVASPNNAANTIKTVTNGQLTLDRPYAKIHVGLPYVCDLQTLDIDSDQGQTIVDRKKLIQKLTIQCEKSRGIWAGSAPPTDDDTDPLEGLTEVKIRTDEVYDSAVSLQTASLDVLIESQWNSNGRIFIRQVDPLPLAVLSVAPAGLIPFGG